jgi:hypothetical protein
MTFKDMSSAAKKPKSATAPVQAAPAVPNKPAVVPAPKTT